jgi:hypothetical protein
MYGTGFDPELFSVENDGVGIGARLKSQTAGVEHPRQTLSSSRVIP